jgi:hypothetical protein
MTARGVDSSFTRPDACVPTCRYRTSACLDLLHQQPTVVRGNGSEVLALAGADAAGEAEPAEQQTSSSGSSDGTATCASTVVK